MKTRITELLGIEYPIFQGAMANISTGAFAAAVSETGALGIISAAARTPEELEAEIHTCRSLTGNPFGINIVLQPLDSIRPLINVMIRENIKIVVTSAGNPVPWIPVLKEAGMTVIPVVAAPRQAVKAEKAGADAIIAEGSESGGHIGDAATFPLLSSVVRSVSIPVAAAGGIADGRGLAGALIMGADAVQCGTAFIATKECPVPAVYKETIIKADVTDTITTGYICRDVVRSLKTPLSIRMADFEMKNYIPQQLLAMGTGALRRAAMDGNWEEGSFQAGQSAGLVDKIVSCRERVESIMQEAYTVFLERSSLFK